MKCDVIVAGAGLAGLSAARDLMNQGTDVIVLEARNRPGGRVEQTTLADGRIVQLGGEVIGPFHRAYVQLAEELGLTIVPSFPQLPGEDTWVLADGRYVGDDFPWMSDADRESYAALNGEFGKLAASVDPEDPWSHPDAERLAAFLTTSQAQLEAELTEEMVAAFGEPARDTQAVFMRRWGVDPWTRGYITGWRPGDVMSVGPLHGTHEPPFYVCGSDQWVCGYMEGAVRTGRRAAAAALGTYVR